MGSESNRRKYPRIRAPKEMLVGWRSAGQTTATRAETMGMGGLFLYAKEPPSVGSMVELVFTLPSGDIRARAIVRSSKAGKGMGVQFMQMRPEDRAKLNRYIASLESTPKPEAPASASNAPSTAAQDPKRSSPARAAAAQQSTRPSAPPPSMTRMIRSPRKEKAAQQQFERELQELVTLTGKGTYYELLGVTSDSPLLQVKKNYHALARKFHPDSHTGSPETMARLKELMVVIAEAYRTLTSEEKRIVYDKRLSARGTVGMHRVTVGAEETVEDWLTTANECIRARNFVGSVVWLRKCVEAVPHNAQYHTLLARSLSTLPQFQHEALGHYQKAIDIDPWKEPAYLQLGDLLETMQLPDQAQRVYAALLEFNPMSAKARERLAALKGAKSEEKSPAFASRWFSRKG